MPERMTHEEMAASAPSRVRSARARGARLSEAVVNTVVAVVFYGTLAVGVGVAVWLIADAFADTPSAGARALCAALLPVVLSTYLRWMQADWLQVLDRIPSIALMLGAALATVVFIAVLSATPDSKIVPLFGLSLAFSAMLLARTDFSVRHARDLGPDPTLVHFFYGIAFALLVAGLFTLEG